MKKFISFSLLLLALGLISSCSRYNTNQLHWLKGSWQDTSRNYFETWSFDGQGTIIGYAYQLNGQDTVFTEDLAIAQVGYGLMYIAKVSNQNEERAVSFGAREVSASEASFTNRQHDFPNRIQYFFVDRKHIRVEISDNQGQQKQTFNFIKIKQ